MPLPIRSEEHTSELQSHDNLVCRLLLEKKKKKITTPLQRKNTTCELDITRSRTPCTRRRGRRPASRRYPHPFRRSVCFFFFFLMIRRPPRSTLFPYPPLFR